MSDFERTGTLAVAALIFFPGIYLWAPALIFFTNRMAAKPRANRFDADRNSLPQQAANYFARVSGAIAQEGFEEVGLYFLPNTASNVEALALLMKNARTDELAMAAAIYATVDGATQLKSTYVEFVSRYSDGRVFDTNNAFVLSCFAKIDGFDTVQFPRVQDLHRLYSLHTERCRRAAPHGQRVNRLIHEFDGDGSRYLSATMAESFARQAGVGYLQLDGEQYRPTVKGACLMTWKLLWPVKQLRTLKRDQRAKRLMSELLPVA